MRRETTIYRETIKRRRSVSCLAIRLVRVSAREKYYFCAVNETSTKLLASSFSPLPPASGRLSWFYDLKSPVSLGKEWREGTASGVVADGYVPRSRPLFAGDTRSRRIFSLRGSTFLGILLAKGRRGDERDDDDGLAWKIIAADTVAATIRRARRKPETSASRLCEPTNLTEESKKRGSKEESVQSSRGNRTERTIREENSLQPPKILILLIRGLYLLLD